MNEIGGFGGFPAEYFTAVQPFSRSSDYFQALAQYLRAYLETQRNVASEDEDITWNRYVAGQHFGKLIPTHGVVGDSGAFPALLRRPAAFEHAC